VPLLRWPGSGIHYHAGNSLEVAFANRTAMSGNWAAGPRCVPTVRSGARAACSTGLVFR